MLDKKKVVVGMSGGVDSAVAAYVLKEQGYEVIGITMKLWEEDEENYAEDYGGCCSLSSVEDARLVCEKLDIPFYVINYNERFIETVVDNFIDEYLNGHTPSPCIRCNKYIKFDELLKTAHGLGAYYVATGHYGIIGYNEDLDRYTISKSKELRKDQTYMMYSLSQDQIKHTLMPLGVFESKEEVRQIAEREDLIVARKNDSQEICFVIDDDYARFVKEHSKKKIPKGKFVDLEGNVLGDHKGIIHYTIGQRKGLGVTFGKPMYVVEIRPKTNEVVLGDNDDVFKTELTAKEFNIITKKELTEPLQCDGKVRYSSKTAPCTIYPLEGDRIKAVFDQPQRAVTPGQSVVFYDGDLLLGGGVIE
ncbi:tRNA 2-thiouridine(34) synthase MnmA [Acidaminobacter sp. JC074]|uniref:tRNA 2-thiouridine(34) synthase MnmA n=1 Tax=Acidaminobacter sp. JC074 TaxID=2530199 RepID=UPI001F0EC9C3|nr:tRNA 2-thiouridine(34) synthase MnmA [Acidaminobacter sp. JC074]MCH4888548.1 tRNA 2-thiouridine(34) synthase MnmA [Acidaminobacter sp. JC074]